MDSNRKGIRVWPVSVVLALSLLLHAALLFLPLPGSQHESSRSDATRMVVDLLPRPIEHMPERPEQAPEPARTPKESEQTKKPAPIASTVSAEDSTEQSVPTETPSLPATTPAVTPAERIQTQLLSAARTLGRQSEQAEEEKGLQYDAAPALPSRPGWLHQYTGRVAQSIDRWKGNDGSRNARVVTGSGQVFYIRTRAPTITETFNPWMSSAVGMISDCGRERPQAADGGDPWLRQPRVGGE